MSTNLQTESFSVVTQSDGGIWYQLREERETICETLLREPAASIQRGSFPVNQVDNEQLQARLRLLDEALDRLMAGTYGDCVVCGKWIEDNKLHADPALRFCCGCQRRSENKVARPGMGANQIGSAFLPDHASHHVRRAWDG